MNPEQAKSLVSRDEEARSAVDQTYDAIWSAIARYELPPGTVLVERNLTERFGFSRTAVREALYRLDHEGVVERIPNHGAFVRKLTPREIVDIISAREAVEGMAARIAALRRPDAGIAEIEALFEALSPPESSEGFARMVSAGTLLHDSILRWSGNRSLQRAYGGLRSEAMLIRTLTQRGSYLDAPPPQIVQIESSSLDDHREIIAAIKARDGAAAEGAMRSHLQKTSRRIIAELVEFAPEQAPDI